MTSLNLSHDQFFSKLADLFESNRSSSKHASVFLTQKRMSYDQATSAASPTSSWDDLADLKPSQPLPLLIRASNGKIKAERKDKVKISTIVQPDELEGFYTRYAEVCRAGMSGLKKRDRKKAKKSKKGAVAKS